MTHPAIIAYRRQLLEQWVEWAIDVLDRMDGEPDLEVEDEHDEAEHEAPGLIRGGNEPVAVAGI